MPAKTPDPPKITLKFGNPKPSGTAGVSVDNEALKRQQDLVNAGANGQASVRSTSRNPFAGSQSVPIPTLGRVSQERARSGSSENPVVNGIKSEAFHRPSPAPAPSQLIATKSESDTRPNSSATAMPPPIAANPRLKSGSPHPQILSTNHYIPTTSYSSTSQFDSSRRISGKGKYSIRLRNTT